MADAGEDAPQKVQGNQGDGLSQRVLRVFEAIDAGSGAAIILIRVDVEVVALYDGAGDLVADVPIGVVGGLVDVVGEQVAGEDAEKQEYPDEPRSARARGRSARRIGCRGCNHG